MEPYISEIRIVSFDFAPKGWALCNGQLLNISQNQALFSLVGTTYGGDGVNNFALPNLQSRVPINFGTKHTLGQQGGQEAHSLTVNEMPSHIHSVSASTNVPNQGMPTGNMWGTNGNAYSNMLDGAMNAASIGKTGNGSGHQNMQPYLVLNYIIALTGVYPPRP